jgi:hypothetical protein
MNISYSGAHDSDERTIRSILEDQKLPTESVGTGRADFFLVLDHTDPVGTAGFEFYGEDALLRSVDSLLNLQGESAAAKLRA